MEELKVGDHILINTLETIVDGFEYRHGQKFVCTSYGNFALSVIKKVDDTEEVSRLKKEEFVTRFIAELHNRVGRCGLCGLHKCEGRQSNSVLPNKISSKVILESLESAKEAPHDREEVA